MQGARHPPIPVSRRSVDELFNNNIKSDGQGGPIQSIHISIFRLKLINLAFILSNLWKVKYSIAVMSLLASKGNNLPLTILIWSRIILDKLDRNFLYNFAVKYRIVLVSCKRNSKLPSLESPSLKHKLSPIIKLRKSNGIRVKLEKIRRGTKRQHTWQTFYPRR